MKSRSRKVMIITVIGMIVMIEDGRGDQHADEKGKMPNYIRDIKHENRTQKEINELESRGEKHETCMIEIKTASGREAKGEAQTNKEEKQEDLSRKGIQYHKLYY